jgi:hypothetical protein
VICNLKDPKNSTKKPLDPINPFSKVAGHKSIYKNWQHFYTSTINRMRKKSGKQPYPQ